MSLGRPRRILVTGATSGIGEAFARTLPRDCDLVLTGRNDAKLDRLARELASERRRVEVVAADLASPKAVEAVVDTARAAPLDGLINNAGLGPYGRFRDAATDQLTAAVDVNCRAPVALTHALLPHLLEGAGGGDRRAFVLNVASTAAYAPVPRMAVYAASKAFVLSFTEALATELRHEPLDVLALCPGPVRTRALPFRVAPGARAPEDVARIGLDAIGRTSVAYSDMATRALLAPLSSARAAVSRALGAGLALTQRG
ncbi:MAG: SDR family NAD(P)-dependent oxidoreductase [Alphaproteobacteria bacterium]